MGIEFPKDFEKRVAEQDRDRRLKEMKNIAKVNRRNREARMSVIFGHLAITDEFEKKVYDILLKQARGKGMTLDSLFHLLSYDFTMGELKETLHLMRDRRHARYEDPFGWMIVEEIHDKLRELEE